MLSVHSVETFGAHDGPGIRLVIFCQGCVFRCLYCQNVDTRALKSPQAKDMNDEEILDLLEKQKPYFKNGGGLTVSGGEPTVQAEALISLFTKAKAAGFHLALDTCGGIYNDQTNQLYDLTDLVILDVKHINPEWHEKLTGHNNDLVLKNAYYREKSGKPMWLRYVLVPGWSDQPEYLEEWGQTFTSYKSIERVEILPYHTLGVYKFKELGIPYQLENVEPPTKEQIENAQKIFTKYFKNVIVR